MSRQVRRAQERKEKKEERAAQVSVAQDAGTSRRMSKALQIAWGERAITNVEDTPIWEVPSQSTGGTYMVNMERRSCECAFWRSTHQECKHLVAVLLQMKKLQIPEGATKDAETIRYKNPPWYDRLQRHEEVHLKHLLRCLGKTIPNGVKDGVGRDPIPWGDILIAAAWANYRNRPSRKAIGDPDVLKPLLQGDPPAPDTLRKYMLMEDLEHIIRRAIVATWMCTRTIDVKFSADSTYKKTPNSKIVEQRKAGGGLQVMQKILNCKLHIVVGTRTLMAYAAEVSDENAHDSRFFVPLLKQFWDKVRIDVVFADAAYSINPENFEAVHARGGRAFLDFQSDDEYNGSPHHDEMFRIYREHYYDIWLPEYAYRPLIETANSMIKRCIKRIIRARMEQSRKNEALLSVLVHNLIRLPHNRAAYAIDIPWADGQAIDLIDRAIEGRGAEESDEAA